MLMFPPEQVLEQVRIHAVTPIMALAHSLRWRFETLLDICTEIADVLLAIWIFTLIVSCG